MSKLFSLLRATMSEGLHLFNYRSQNERTRRTLPVLLAVMIGVMMWFSTTAMTVEFKEDNAEYVILSLYTIITTVIILMEGVYKSGDLLFRPHDNDTLLAMPIKKSTIVSARMIKFYVFEMLYCLIFLLPAILAYVMNVEVGTSFYLVAMTMLVLVPVIPIAVSCIVGLITTAISTRFRHKTFLQVALSFVALFAVAILMLKINATSDFGGQSMIAVSNRMTEFYYPADAFVKLATHFDWGQYLLFVGINLVVVLITVFLISRFYFQIVSRMSTIKRAENVSADYRFSRHSQTAAMVRKEMNRYFSTPILLTNTAIGLVLFLVAVGALCFKYDDIASSLVAGVEDFPLTVDELSSYMPSVAFVLVAFASLMTFITATMISLEGKAFNLLKSMPISGVKVIMTKVLAAMLLIVPVTAFGSIVMFVRFQFGILDALLILIAVIALPLVTELIGILVNLKYARFDAESDAVTVKQSASVMVSTFVGLGTVMVTFSLTIATVLMAGQTVGLVMMDAIFVIVAAYLYFVVAMRGEEKYMKLSA